MREFKPNTRVLAWVILVSAFVLLTALWRPFRFRPSRLPQEFGHQVLGRIQIGGTLESATNQMMGLGFVPSMDGHPKVFHYQTRSNGQWSTVSNLDLVLYVRHEVGPLTVSTWKVAFAVDAGGRVTNVFCSYLKDFRSMF